MKINEETGLYENYGGWHIPFWQTKHFLCGVKIFVALLLLLIGLLIIKKYIRYKKNKKLSPIEQILADLSELQHVHENSKEFYIQLSDIIKRYFFYRYHYDVLGKTDTELVDYLLQVHENQKNIEEIKNILRGSEIIKFANAQTIQERMRMDCERMVSIVQQDLENKKNNS